MRRAFAMLAFLAAAAVLAGVTLTEAAPASSLKGARAILVDGKQLAQQVRIHGDMDATSLMIVLMRSIGNETARTDAPAADGGRACFRVSVILPQSELQSIPDEKLTPDHAYFTYWFYPAVAGNEAALVSAGSSYPLTELAMTQLERHGVPVRVEPGAAVACERPDGP